MNGAGDSTPAIAQALRRLEELTSTLDALRDSSARQTARELLELVLDLHGLGLARLSAAITSSDNAPGLMERLVADPYVRALLLLHGLHPHSAEERLREAIERMRVEWDRQGISVDLLSASSASAHVRIKISGEPGQAELLRSEVEGVLLDAAPDLDDLTVEISSVECERPEAFTDGGERLSAR